MDLKIVIKQLLDKGLTREQVISNLEELGVSDAEKLFDQAVGMPKPPAPQPQQEQAPKGLFKEMQEPQQRQTPPAQKKGELEINVSELVESEGKSLFKTREKEPERPEVEIITQEKEPEEAPEKEEKAWKPSGKEPQTLEGKIDEALALLKALESINEKILDTDRKILLRNKN